MFYTPHGDSSKKQDYMLKTMKDGKNAEIFLYSSILRYFIQIHKMYFEVTQKSLQNLQHY